MQFRYCFLFSFSFFLYSLLPFWIDWDVFISPFFSAPIKTWTLKWTRHFRLQHSEISRRFTRTLLPLPWENEVSFVFLVIVEWHWNVGNKIEFTAQWNLGIKLLSSLPLWNFGFLVVCSQLARVDFDGHFTSEISGESSTAIDKRRRPLTSMRRWPPLAGSAWKFPLELSRMQCRTEGKFGCVMAKLA